MANKHLSGKPHKIPNERHAWWYEEVKGITVIVHRDAILASGSAVITIPWANIRKALGRKDREA